MSKRVISIMLLCGMIAGLAGCGSTPAQSTSAAATSAPATTETTAAAVASAETTSVAETTAATETTADTTTAASTSAAAVSTTAQTDTSPGGPEPITFNIMYAGPMNPWEKPVLIDYAKEREDYNVTLEWVSIGAEQSDALEKVNVLFSSGSQGDAIFPNILQESDISRLSANGLLAPIEGYINMENTPNIQTLFERRPSAKVISTLSDGHMYSLPRYIGNSGDFLESPFWINKTWLDELNLSVPTTIDEFFDVLMAFKTQDPNKNGEADEIPIIARNGTSMSHLEAYLGIWGLATKDSSFDSFVMVENGIVKFVPTMDEYKTAIGYLNKLYTNGLIYADVFTCTEETLNAKLTPDVLNFGVVNIKTLPKFQDDFIQMIPPKADGYESKWFYHPGSLGVKNFFEITNKCADPGRLLNYIDGLWNPEQTLKNIYGPIGDVLIKKDDGTYGFQDPPGGVSLAEYQQYNAIGPYYVLYDEDYGTLFEISKNDALMMDSYNMYKNILNKEIWPRPYFSEENVSRMSELRTDIFNTVSQMKAKWVTGQANIDADWDSYLNDLNKMGIDEFIALCQNAYDVFNSAQ